MIDKNYLPKELQGVYDYFTEENCCPNYLSKSKLLNNVYNGLVRCGRGDDVFECINIVVELYWIFGGVNKAHKVHAIFNGIHGRYEQCKQDIFAAVYYLLRRTGKVGLLIEIIESKLDPDLPFGEPTSLGVFKQMIECEEEEHEDFLRTQDVVYHLYGQWNEDDWCDHINDFENNILSNYTFGRATYEQYQAREAEQEYNKALEEHYNSPEGQAEVENYLVNSPTLEEIENAPGIAEKEKDQNDAIYTFAFIKTEKTKKHKELYELCQTNGKPAVIVDKLLEYHQEKAIKVYQCNKKQAYEILKVAGMKYSDSNFYKILTNHKAGHLFQGDLKPKKI